MTVEQQRQGTLEETYPSTRESEITLAEIVKIILRRRYGILIVLLSSLTLAYLYHQTLTPEYRADLVMMINAPNNPGDILESVLGSGAADSKASKKDMELLKSMPIAELAVRKLAESGGSLEFFGNREYLSPMKRFFEPFRIFGSSKPSVPLLPDSDQLLRSYALKLSGRTQVEAVRETNLLKVSVSSPFADESVFLTNTLCRAYRDFDINRNSEKYSQASSFIANMLQAQQKKVADADNAQTSYMAAHEIYEFSGNTQQLLDKLIETDAKVNSIKTEYNITRNSLAFLEKKLTEADKELSQHVAQNVSRQLGSIMDEIRSHQSSYIQLLREKGAENPEVKQQKQQLDVVKTRYEQLSRSKIAGAIGYAGLAQKANFDMVAEKLQIERKLNELNFGMTEFSRLKQYYESQLSTLPQKQQNYARLLRDREVVNKTYMFLKEKSDEARILLGSEVGSVTLVGSAFRPFSPEKPELKKSMLMGLVLGGLLALLFTYVAEFLDSTIKDESFFSDIGLPLLASIPFVNLGSKNEASADKLSLWPRILYNSSKVFREKVLKYSSSDQRKPNIPKSGEVPMLMINENLLSPFAESFRMLRTALDYSCVDTPLHTILVSGTAMSEGKSTVCANLGLSYALAGKKTLIIDCDLRRASQHRKFKGNREPGLTDFLFSSHTSMDESYFQPTHFENLFYVSAGRKLQDHTELFGSNKIAILLEDLEAKFDKIILDCPPLFLSDAAQLAHIADAIMLVARIDYTSKGPVHDFTVDHYLKSRMVGVVVIESPNKPLFGYGKYGYGKYGYGKSGYGKYGYGKYGYGKYGYNNYEEAS